jgi:hypothetical protein
MDGGKGRREGREEGEGGTHIDPGAVRELVGARGGIGLGLLLLLRIVRNVAAGLFDLPHHLQLG